MKKKVIVILMALIMCVMGIFTVETEVKAEGIGEDVDYTALLTEDALIGHSQMQTWGVYLAEGTSVINDAGGGKIGAGGMTAAAVRCKVSVTAIVERKNASGNWVRVTSWSVVNENALIAIASKYISVTSGYWYRVRCTHTAGTDGSGSCTDALWM